MVVPAFVHIFIRTEEIGPSGIVDRPLELELINEERLFLDVSHEVLDLREHAHVIGLEGSADLAVGLRGRNCWHQSELIVIDHSDVPDVAEHFSEFEIFLFGFDLEVLVRVDS
jgi:hypothetical protein